MDWSVGLKISIVGGSLFAGTFLGLVVLALSGRKLSETPQVERLFWGLLILCGVIVLAGLFKGW